MKAARALRYDEYATEEDAEQSPKRRKEAEPAVYMLVLPATSKIQPGKGVYLYVVHLQDVETLPTVSARSVPASSQTLLRLSAFLVSTVP
jgi:hypothetical protein